MWTSLIALLVSALKAIGAAIGPTFQAIMWSKAQKAARDEITAEARKVENDYAKEKARIAREQPIDLNDLRRQLHERERRDNS